MIQSYIILHSTVFAFDSEACPADRAVQVSLVLDQASSAGLIQRRESIQSI